MKVILSRRYGNSETKGALIIVDGEVKLFECKTIELPDMGNQKNFSCIPEGVYDVVKYESPSKGPCFHVLNVPGRNNILIHKGNYAAGRHIDTQGCILPGTRLEDINGDGNIDVVGSAATMKRLLKILSDNFKLYIL